MRLTIDQNQELAKYADPLLLPSRSRIPVSVNQVLELSQFLYHGNPIFRRAVKRLIAHGVTRLTFRGKTGSTDEREKFEKFFIETVGGLGQIRLLGEEFMAYGVAMMRAHFPFVRQLVDDRNGDYKVYTLASFPEERVSFDLQRLTYKVPDPKRSDLPVSRRPPVNLRFVDLACKEHGRIRLVRMDPKYSKLRYSTWSNERQVEYSFEPAFKNRIRKGDLFEVNRTPLDILRAVRDNKGYLFDSDAVFLWVNETIVGFSDDGWGLPELMVSYPHLHKISLYDRLDESISNEMLVPYRVVSPNFSGVANGEAVILSGQFMGAVEKMKREQQKDRTRMHGFPVPINYQELGGNGKSLAPKDLKDYEVQQLMQSMGIPPELYSGSLSIGNVPYAVRLLESSSSQLFFGLSMATNWAVRKLTRFMHGEAMDAVLEPSTFADDLERKNMVAQLFSAGELPRRVMFDSLNLERPLDLRRERAQEDLDIQQELANLDQEARRKLEMGSLDDVLGAEAQEAAPAASSVVTPTDLQGKAQMLAMEWLAMPEGQRMTAMQSVKSQDRILYATAKDFMDEMRRQGEAQGRQQVYQQAQAPQAGQPV